MMLLTAILLSAPSQQLEIVKEQLFTEWTTTARIANVSFGLPTDAEVESVMHQMKECREEIELAIAMELSEMETEVDLPFLLAMVDGISMEHAPKFAEQCANHLNMLENEFTGIAASRLLRMQYRSATILGEEIVSSESKEAFWALAHPHPEDVVVFTLSEIQESFQSNNVVRAHQLYDKLATKLNRKSTQYLRVPFAHGYARVSPTTHEALYGWFELAEWLLDYGYEQSIVDEELIKWINRLPNPPNISPESNDSRISSLALRRIIANNPHLDNGRLLQQLMALARKGDGRAAERVLENGESEFFEEAFSLVIKFPKRIKLSVEYWQLYVANLDMKNRNVEQARTRLTPIAMGNGRYHSTAIEMLKRIDEMELITLHDAFGIHSRGELPTCLSKQFSQSTMHDLLGQCISICHNNGVDEWSKAALTLLLENAEGLPLILVAEANRLLGNCDRAIPLFEEAIKLDGPSIQTIAGLADCRKDRDAMNRVMQSTSPEGESSYWFWFSNTRLIQWFIEDGGDKDEAQAKVNRLRKKDATLGGVQFMSQFNLMIR